jgi:hypothetical protein
LQKKKKKRKKEKKIQKKKKEKYGHITLRYLAYERNSVFDIVAYLLVLTAPLFILDRRGREVLVNQPYRSLIYGF